MLRRQEAIMLSSEILERSSQDGNGGLRRGAWSSEEDVLLRECVEKYGEGRWHQVPSRAGLRRCRKSCRLRWLNYLKPNIKRGEFADDEIDLIIRMHMLLGNRWSLIAGRIPGRTANDIKNYWNSHLSKMKLGLQLPFPPGYVLNNKKDGDMKAPLRTVSKCENKRKNKKNDSKAASTTVVKPQPRTIISRAQLPNNATPSKISEAKEAPIRVGASEVEEWGDLGVLDMEFLHALLS